ncbi:HAD-IA family hydrolase [Ruminococcaceae bacterium OttesenSCG-928-A16]|nr:HAD-IA family hydrolase [Ruminococcaceae bacterium OttesenSCG-928-A16]
MYTTVLFDLDGTLLDTLQDLAAAGNHTLSALGLPPHPVNAYRKMVGNGIPKLIERMLPKNCRGEATQKIANNLFARYYAQHMDDFTHPYYGISGLLQTLKQRGILLGVVTNKAHPFATQVVQQHFAGIFNAVIGLQEGFEAKPHPGLVQHIMGQLGAVPATTLYCGDSDVDMYTARNAGLTSCGVLWGFRDEEELTAAGANFLASDVEALAQIILEEPLL